MAQHFYQTYPIPTVTSTGPIITVPPGGPTATVSGGVSGSSSGRAGKFGVGLCYGCIWENGSCVGVGVGVGVVWPCGADRLVPTRSHSLP
jgi:hypothetical protein